MSDNCDHNFGTLDDFGVKNDQKVSHNMRLMSKYKGKHGGKKGQKIRAWVDPPHSGPGCGHINSVKVDEKCGEMRIKLSDHCYP